MIHRNPTSLTPRSLWPLGLLVLSWSIAACSSDAAAPGPPHGAPGEIIDVDAGSIPLGESGGNSAGGGSGVSSGAAGQSGAGSSGAAGVGGAAAGGSAGLGGSVSLPPDHGVSTPCASSSDCSAPLVCHYDTQDNIAPQQCALFCDSDDACKAALGAQSFCIGANICVHACKSDADCVARTHCNTAGWCERGGPGSGVPYCGGFATPCSALSALQCIGAAGCTDDSKCSGLATGCYSLFDSYSCSSQQGCYWSTSSSSCGGFAASCDGMSGQFSCGDQRGCSWSGGCTGTPKTCAAQFVSLCTDQPGCQLQTD